MKIIKSGECLMIELADHRKLFTQKRNFPQLIEFSKTFNAEVSVVKCEGETELLDLQEIPPAICSDSKPNVPSKVQVIQKRISRKKLKDRKTMLRQAERIRDHMSKKFLDGKAVKLKDVKRRYSQYELSSSAFSNHLKRVRKELKDDGHKIKKIKAGEYKIEE